MVDISVNFPSPVEGINFRGLDLFIKRDDLLHPDFSGNKARKFHYFLEREFGHITKVVSYGSNQSNAMYSLSVLAKMKGWEFDYYVDHIPTYLQENPHGNYAGALKNGMVLKTKNEKIKTKNENILFIEEGGRQAEAGYGTKILAEEIMDWQRENGVEQLDVFLPSGTGTTALYLQKSFVTNGVRPANDSSVTPLWWTDKSFEVRPRVYTCPVVGGREYLKKQFTMLEPDEAYHPTILELPKKYHFGKLYREFYEIWIELQQGTGVEFDLLYDPQGWMTLMAHREKLGANVMYIHQGGLLGNESMLPRYLRKFPQISSEKLKTKNEK